MNPHHITVAVNNITHYMYSRLTDNLNLLEKWKKLFLGVQVITLSKQLTRNKGMNLSEWMGKWSIIYGTHNGAPF